MYLSLVNELAAAIIAYGGNVINECPVGAAYEEDNAKKVVESIITDSQCRSLSRFSQELADRVSKELRSIVSSLVKQINGITTVIHLCAMIKTAGVRWYDAAVKSNEYVNRGPFQLTSEDYSSINVHYDPEFQARSLECSHFVFYKLNERWAKNYLFGLTTSPWLDLMRVDPCAFFTEKGYSFTANPYIGDLVVYCSSKNGRFKPKHYGIWTDKGKVLGKLGVLDVYEHPLEEVFISYGNVVYFFHKQITTSLQTEFLELVDSFSSFPDKSFGRR